MTDTSETNVHTMLNSNVRDIIVEITFPYCEGNMTGDKLETELNDILEQNKDRFHDMGYLGEPIVSDIYETK